MQGRNYATLIGNNSSTKSFFVAPSMSELKHKKQDAVISKDARSLKKQTYKMKLNTRRLYSRAEIFSMPSLSLFHACLVNVANHGMLLRTVGADFPHPAHRFVCCVVRHIPYLHNKS
jgi:hypothetical protein